MYGPARSEYGRWLRRLTDKSIEPATLDIQTGMTESVSIGEVVVEGVALKDEEISLLFEFSKPFEITEEIRLKPEYAELFGSDSMEYTRSFSVGELLTCSLILWDPEEKGGNDCAVVTFDEPIPKLIAKDLTLKMEGEIPALEAPDAILACMSNFLAPHAFLQIQRQGEMVNFLLAFRGWDTLYEKTVPFEDVQAGLKAEEG